MKKQLFRSALLALTISLLGCSGGDDAPVNDGQTPPDNNPTPVNYELGDEGPGGGIIFYLDASKEHGLEVTPVIGIARWMNVSQNPYNIAGLKDEMGTGMANTEKIIAQLGNEGVYAAKICADYVQGGKDDWYLPTKAELEKIYWFYKYGPACGGCFSIFETLWSSSPKYVTNFEGNQVINGVWITDFGISASWPEIVILTDTPYADGGLHVRAVRNF
ncbi:MAG: hypothetical protein DI539_02095 [Flavobacterium psychrophilum]|nr:MAG: hypothetical protein DI539_02095 [Flavobacterium psychrophilum]